MNNQLYVLLYSKYSPTSMNLLKALESSPVNLSSSIGLQVLSVDNNKIRKKILNHKMGINVVPCILVYRNNIVEKYEGSDAILWIEETVKSLLPPEPQQSYQEERPKKTKKSKKPKQATPVVAEPEEPEEQEDVEEPDTELMEHIQQVSQGQGGGNDNFDMLADIDDITPKMQEQPVQTNTGGSAILAKAMEMQHARESQELNPRMQHRR